MLSLETLDMVETEFWLDNEDVIEGLEDTIEEDTIELVEELTEEVEKKPINEVVEATGELEAVVRYELRVEDRPRPRGDVVAERDGLVVYDTVDVVGEDIREDLLVDEGRRVELEIE